MPSEDACMSASSIDLFEHPPAEFAGGVVTVGNFDGVHRGHAALVAAAKVLSLSMGGPVIAVTFDPPPLALLDPGAIKPSLSTLAERRERLLAAGATGVATLRTDAALLSLSAESFFEEVILGQFRAKAIVEGFNFRFGRGRSGDAVLLRELCRSHGLAFEVVPPLLDGGEAISSSRIRQALARGDVSAAARWLGRPYAIEGTVVTGLQRGRTIGFPTANLTNVATVIPAPGVYATRIRLGDVWQPAAANVGANPTFGEADAKIEAHVLDWSGDLYGRAVRLEFVSRLRDTIAFEGIEQLKAQLAVDVQRCRAALAVTFGSHQGDSSEPASQNSTSA